MAAAVQKHRTTSAPAGSDSILLALMRLLIRNLSSMAFLLLLRRGLLIFDGLLRERHLAPLPDHGSPSTEKCVLNASLLLGGQSIPTIAKASRNTVSPSPHCDRALRSQNPPTMAANINTRSHDAVKPAYARRHV